jgi:hypothetical protein
MERIVLYVGLTGSCQLFCIFETGSCRELIAARLGSQIPNLWMTRVINWTSSHAKNLLNLTKIK